MFERIFQLKQQGLSPEQIAEKLNSEGLKTARGKDWAQHSVAYQLKHGAGGISAFATGKSTKAKKKATPVVSAAVKKRRAGGSSTPQMIAARQADFQGGGMSTADALVIGRMANDALLNQGLSLAGRVSLACGILSSFQGLT